MDPAWEEEGGSGSSEYKEYSEDSEEEEDEEGDFAVQNKQGAKGAAKGAPVEWYDEEEDEQTEEWVQKKRHGLQSDAILSCPACLSTVCIDCQRHETDRTQYRAMFSMGCRVKRDKITVLPPEGFPTKGSTSKRKRGKHVEGDPSLVGETEHLESTAEQQSGHCQAPREERFFAVECAECGTEVAKLDEAKVFHFFNVIPSYS